MFNEFLDTNRTTLAADVSHGRVELLAHDMRDLLHTAFLAYAAIQAAGRGGAATAALGRSLVGLRDLLDRSLEELHPHRGPHEEEPHGKDPSSPDREMH